MSTKDIKKKKEAKLAETKREDVKLYRLMVEFVLAIVMVGLVIFSSENFFALSKAGASAKLRIDLTVIVTAVIFAAAAVFATVRRKKNTDESLKVFTRAGVFGNAAVLFFSAVHFSLFWDAEELIISIISVAVLYFVHNIYGGLYFMYSLITGAGFIALQIAGRTAPTIGVAASAAVSGAKIVAFIIPVAAIIYTTIRASRTKLSKYAVACAIISSLIVFAGAVLSVIYPAYVIYAIFALLGFYIATTVVYTVKMM